MADFNDALAIGTVLQGEAYAYTIQRVLGQGSFGITYEATIQLKGRLGTLNAQGARVAVKEFFMKDVNGRNDADSQSITVGSTDGMFADYMRKFKREARNLAQLEHNNIINVLEAFEANQTVYYVMEYIGGGSLDDLIKQRGRIDEQTAINYISQMGSALAAMHAKGMLHLDLKPSNVMMRDINTPVLIDFGLSKHFDERGNAEASTKIGGGTPGYAPLEQSSYTKDNKVPVTMDIYALGATLFKMLTGNRPPEASEIFNEGFPTNELEAAGVSPATIQSVQKAMASRKIDRFQTVDAFVAALNNAAPDSALSAHQSVNVEPVDSEKTEIYTPSGNIGGGGGHGGNTPPPYSPDTESEATVIIGRGSTPKPTPDANPYEDSDISFREEEPEHKNNTLKIILIFAVCAIVTGLAVYFIMHSNSSSADDSDSILEETVAVVEANTVSDLALKNNVGDFTYSGEVNEENQPHGKGKATFVNGNVYDGEWENGKMTGQCVYTLSNGDTFEGTFRNNYYEKGKYTIKANGEYFEGTYKNGNPDQGKWYNKDGVFIQ